MKVYLGNRPFMGQLAHPPYPPPCAPKRVAPMSTIEVNWSGPTLRAVRATPRFLVSLPPSQIRGSTGRVAAEREGPLEVASQEFPSPSSSTTPQETPLFLACRPPPSRRLISKRWRPVMGRTDHGQAYAQ
jgi:hypothetical protein